jgi:hypothetical protein
MDIEQDIEQRVRQQRVKHIVSSYHLAETNNDTAERASAADELEKFNVYLDQLLERYPSPLVELALVQTLAQAWLRVPMLRGVAFLAIVDKQLQEWQQGPITTAITPNQFQQITGLDPSPIFGGTGQPQPQPVSPPLG